MATITIPGHTFRNIDLVIFDKDGTLMELHHYWSEMCILRADRITERLDLSKEEWRALLYAMGVDAVKKRLQPEGPVGIKKREVVMQAAVDYLASVGHNDTSSICYEVFEEVDAFSANILERLVIPIPGAGDCIQQIKTSGCKSAIATTDRSYRASLAMDILGFGKSMDIIVGADCVSETKPSPEMVYYILDKLGVDRSRALMVGDASTDVDMGKRAGMAGTIGVLTGQTSRDVLEKYTPYIVGSVADIKVISSANDTE